MRDLTLLGLPEKQLAFDKWLITAEVTGHKKPPRDEKRRLDECMTWGKGVLMKANSGAEER